MTVVHMWWKSSKKYIYSNLTGLQPSTLIKNQDSFTGNPLSEKCRNTGILWSVFSRIWTESFTWKICIWFCPYTGTCGSEKAPILAYFTQCFSVPNFYNSLTWKRNTLRGIKKFYQPPSITPLQLGIILESIRRKALG